MGRTLRPGTMRDGRLAARLRRGLLLFRFLAAAAGQTLEEGRTLLRGAGLLHRLSLLAEEGRQVALARLHPVEVARNIRALCLRLRPDSARRDDGRFRFPRGLLPLLGLVNDDLGLVVLRVELAGRTRRRGALFRLDAEFGLRRSRRHPFLDPLDLRLNRVGRTRSMRLGGR